MRQIRILLRDHKTVDNLLLLGWLHRAECALQASLSYKDLER